MKEWKIVIYSGEKEVRSVPLSHEYETDEEAMREATHLADKECGEDEDWTLVEEDKSYVATISLCVCQN